MNPKELDRIGRTLAGVLRHFPERFGLDMDDRGWVDIEHFVHALHRKDGRLRWLKSHHIQAVIDTDPKGRYEVRNTKIRATYGHSIDLHLDLPTDDIPDELFYPATEEEWEILLETGLKPADRSMVHLSRTFRDADIAGKHRVDNPVILVVDAKKAIDDGFKVMQAGTTVFLVKDVPAEYLARAETPEGYVEPVIEEVPDGEK